MNEIQDFLAGAGWRGAQYVAMAPDASARKFWRVSLAGASGRVGRSVLMDYPCGSDLAPFLEVARWLRGHGLSAPEVYASDSEAGFILVEDLGDTLLARLCVAHPERQRELYAAATDLLVTFQRLEPPVGLPCLTTGVMVDLCRLAQEWVPGAPQGPEFAEMLYGRLAALVPEGDRVLHRDYHAENLLWLPQRAGQRRVGIIDFQDAYIGPAGYDLVSLLQDARRDVPEALEREMMARYCAEIGGGAAFGAAYAALGLQRNLRIVAVFCRLVCKFGKPHYARYLPRVRGYLRRSLAHPALVDLAEPLAWALHPFEEDPAWGQVVTGKQSYGATG